ncbi:MAG: hypothetical protein LBT33_07375, partial [Spirochaetia bacterium]|nr:hypothetical protein [Spirochaetia bacterium]
RLPAIAVAVYWPSAISLVATIGRSPAKSRNFRDCRARIGGAKRSAGRGSEPTNAGLAKGDSRPHTGGRDFAEQNRGLFRNSMCAKRTCAFL